MSEPFNELLKEAGLNKLELGRELHLGETTVYRWGQEPPGYAVAYLQQRIRLNMCVSTIKLAGLNIEDGT